MKYLYILSFLFLVACSREVITTAHDLEVKLVGTDAAYCILSTRVNRYALSAPGTVYVERDDDDLKIDCSDNLSDRRRTLLVKSEFSHGYWTYPETVIVDFASSSDNIIQNGYRGTSDSVNVSEVLTEKSYSNPVPRKQILRVDTYNTLETQQIITEQPMMPANTNMMPMPQNIITPATPANIPDAYIGRKSYPVRLD